MRAGQLTEIHDAQTFEVFSCQLATEVNTETSAAWVLTEEGEEEPELDKELIARVIAHTGQQNRSDVY